MIDFRSDTVTRPTAAMRAAMASAEVGDDVLGDDPTVQRLQSVAAAMLGFEAALFVPSGTQANLIAVLSHCGRGDEAICGQQQHIYRWEAGGMAVLGSIQPQPLENRPDGTLDLAAVEAAIKPDDPHLARTRLICAENTIGGKVLPIDYLAALRVLATRRGLATHLDGARLFNAAVEMARVGRAGGADAVANAGAGAGAGASAAAAAGAGTGATAARGEAGGVTGGATGHATDPRDVARAICSHFDTVSVCLSKGLGAPVGSLLLGPAELIRRAHRHRKILGGGMRQAGILAAAGLHALEHHVDRLAIDHELATRLGNGFGRLATRYAGLSVQPARTNMVFVQVDPSIAQKLGEHLTAAGIRCSTGYDRGMPVQRWVAHLDLKSADVDEAVATVESFLQQQ